MSIRVLVAASHESASYREAWRKAGIGSVWVKTENVLSLIEGPASADFVFDAVVVFGRLPFTGPRIAFDELAVRTADQIAALPQQTAMFDGKRWCAIPIIVIVSGNHTFALPNRDDVTIIESRRPDKTVPETIREKVEAYRQALLCEYDNLGFIVRYEGGRYIVGPALKSHAGIEGRYYFGDGDQRPKGFVTIHRDRLGIQHEVEKFEALINREDVTEQELQLFFEEHPHFLSQDHTALPHVRLDAHDGSVLIPDFILKPIVAQQRDSRWEILDLKRPNVPLLAGKRLNRKRLSSKVHDAIRQLRDYREHLQDPRHAQAVERVLGHPVRRPRLGVLIGRMKQAEIESLEHELDDELSRVRIVTYDEILEEQVARLSR